jgi:hypothetical protein
VAASVADELMANEQVRRSSQHHMQHEVAVELRRAVAGKEASDAAAQEQAAQIANPRRPPLEVAAGISDIVQNIDSLGGQRQAQIKSENEQVSRVAQHLMSTEVQCSFAMSIALIENATRWSLNRLFYVTSSVGWRQSSWLVLLGVDPESPVFKAPPVKFNRMPLGCHFLPLHAPSGTPHHTEGWT